MTFQHHSFPGTTAALPHWVLKQSLAFGLDLMALIAALPPSSDYLTQRAGGSVHIPAFSADVPNTRTISLQPERTINGSL